RESPRMRRIGAVAAVTFLLASACATTGLSGTPSPAESVAADALRARVTAARAARRLPAAAPLIPAQTHPDALRSSIPRGRAPVAAIDSAMGNAANDSDRDIRVMWGEVDDLDRMGFRPGMIRAPVLNIAIAVIDRGAGNIDGRYLVLFAVGLQGLQV